MNEQLASIARDVIHECREEQWPEDDVKWIACGALLKRLEAQDADFEPTKEHMAAIQALVKQVMQELSFSP
jgi:hypothetical protein